MKKTTVTIIIPAYNSEKNIANLLRSLLNQKQESIRVERILVYSDGSLDKTVKEAKSVNGKRIEIITAKKNRGYAYAFQTLINMNKSQFIIELNDDIKINSKDVIESLVKPYRLNNKVGLVGGNIQALKPETFIGRCIYTSYLAFLPLRYKQRNGQTDLTCDGKILGLSHDFASTLDLKKAKTGNVDIYLYYQNLNQGRVYKFARKAKVFFRLPETISDFKSQEIRSRVSRANIESNFSSLYKLKHQISRADYLKSILAVLIRYPLESLVFKLFINRSHNRARKSYSKWSLALTTKKLSLLYTDFENFITAL